MLTDARLLAAFGLYVLAARVCLGLGGIWRMPSFAILNILTVGTVFYWKLHPGLYFLLAYVVVVLIHWGLTRTLCRRGHWGFTTAVLFPLAALVLVKYVPGWSWALRALGARPDPENAATYVVGISYTAFRLSQMTVEVRNGTVEPPSIWAHLAYAFFPATMAVGPINPYTVHARSLDSAVHARVQWRAAAWRIFAGTTKYIFFANIFNQLSYAGLVTDHRPHVKLDWGVSAVCYYLYLYCNFSGFCDIGIGIAAMLGITVLENFDRPFSARNLREFWNRWHITLSIYMRDMVFTPLSKVLIRVFGFHNRDHAVGIAIFAVFVLIGVWHGAGLNYVLFGLIHAIGVTANHYWTIALKRGLGPAGFQKYCRSKLIHAAGVCTTFVYVAGSLGVFANNKGFGRTLAFFGFVR